MALLQETFFFYELPTLPARSPCDKLTWLRKRAFPPSPHRARRFQYTSRTGGGGGGGLRVRGCKLSSGSSRTPPPLNALPSSRPRGCRCKWRSHPPDQNPGAARCGRPEESGAGCRSPPPELAGPRRLGGRARSGAGTEPRVESPRGCRAGRPCSLLGGGRGGGRETRKPGAARRSAGRAANRPPLCRGPGEKGRAWDASRTGAVAPCLAPPREPKPALCPESLLDLGGCLHCRAGAVPLDVTAL